MARIPMLDEDNPYGDSDAVAFLQDAGAQMGQTLNTMRGMANHPKLGRAFFDFAMSFPRREARSSQAPGLRSLTWPRTLPSLQDGLVSGPTVEVSGFEPPTSTLRKW